MLPKEKGKNQHHPAMRYNNDMSTICTFGYKSGTNVRGVATTFQLDLRPPL